MSDVERRTRYREAPGAPDCPLAMQDPPPEAMEQVAAYFQALSEPTRLRILNLLRDGERGTSARSRS